MRSKIVEDMISKVESTAEKDRLTRDEMILVVATIMKAMMEDARCNLMEIEINDKKLVVGLRQADSEQPYPLTHTAPVH
ncbi:MULTISPECIES: hypothetical protein [unclassified Enterobacter]|uniref:hypothetical protein n=1 Tax=unclassified Enterobacter TaxID=2608935 RepID=UPI00292BF522|nr:hypothetical protein [Enterobacter sp. 23-M-SZ-13]MDV0597030.1 hypothetical protein [Enterobacter sp. 23-M-SZ-13]